MRSLYILAIAKNLNNNKCLKKLHQKIVIVAIANVLHANAKIIVIVDVKVVFVFLRMHQKKHQSQIKYDYEKIENEKNTHQNMSITGSILSLPSQISIVWKNSGFFVKHENNFNYTIEIYPVDYSMMDLLKIFNLVDEKYVSLFYPRVRIHGTDNKYLLYSVTYSDNTARVGCRINFDIHNAQELMDTLMQLYVRHETTYLRSKY